MNKINKDDWRLMGQEKYLKGVVLKWKPYKKPKPEWDHDHCSFCTEKFMEQKGDEILNEGYATENDYYWICKNCFEDFKKMFEWKVE